MNEKLAVSQWKIHQYDENSFSIQMAQLPALHTRINCRGKFFLTGGNARCVVRYFPLMFFLTIPEYVEYTNIVR